MSTSQYIAGLLGPLLVVQALALLFRQDMFVALVKNLSGLTALIYLSGILTMTAGLAIVQSHNLWVSDWRVVITVFGWLAVFAGIARILLPDRLAQIAEPWLQNRMAAVIGGIILVVLGAFLMTKAYAIL